MTGEKSDFSWKCVFNIEGDFLALAVHRKSSLSSSYVLASLLIGIYSKPIPHTVCYTSWLLPGNRKLVSHPACLIKEGGCEDLSMDTLHLKYSLVLFGSGGSALTLTLFLLWHRIIMLCHCSSTMVKEHFLLISYGTKGPLCVNVPLNTYAFMYSIVISGVYLHICLILMEIYWERRNALQNI